MSRCLGHSPRPAGLSRVSRDRALGNEVREDRIGGVTHKASSSIAKALASSPSVCTHRTAHSFTQNRNCTRTSTGSDFHLERVAQADPVHCAPGSTSSLRCKGKPTFLAGLMASQNKGCVSQPLSLSCK